MLVDRSVIEPSSCLVVLVSRKAMEPSDSVLIVNLHKHSVILMASWKKIFRIGWRHEAMDPSTSGIYFLSMSSI